MNTYYIYILHCTDSSYYTDVTNDIERRFKEHEDGENKNCYTYKIRTVELVYLERFHNIDNAIDYEKQIKGWSRKKKEALINDAFDKLRKLSKNYTEHGKPLDEASTGSA